VGFFMEDPSAPRALAATPDPDEVRLQLLIRKLFGKK